MLLVLILAGAPAGCKSPTPPETGTGAREAARGYYEALARMDWEAAYASLESDSRGRYRRDEFARLAAEYRRKLGFDPRGVTVRACEEQGDAAIAHVVLTGAAPAGRKSFRDGISLRREGTTWGVKLPHRFGRETP